MPKDIKDNMNECHYIKAQSIKKIFQTDVVYAAPAEHTVKDYQKEIRK